MADRLETARLFYAAFAAGDRALVESTITADFTFSSPPDPHLDRDGYFARCWPHAGQGQTFEFVRLIPHGDEVIVTYKMRQDGAARTRRHRTEHRGPHLRRRQDQPRRGLLRLVRAGLSRRDGQLSGLDVARDDGEVVRQLVATAR